MKFQGICDGARVCVNWLALLARQKTILTGGWNQLEQGPENQAASPISIEILSTRQQFLDFAVTAHCLLRQSSRGGSGLASTPFWIDGVGQDTPRASQQSPRGRRLG